MAALDHLATYLGDRTFVNVLVESLPTPVLVSATGAAEIDMLTPDQPVWLAFNGQTVVIPGA